MGNVGFLRGGLFHARCGRMAGMKGSRFHFRISHLLGIVLLVAAAMAWIVTERERRNAQVQRQLGILERTRKAWVVEGSLDSAAALSPIDIEIDNIRRQLGGNSSNPR
jgi:hypothetical protein